MDIDDIDQMTSDTLKALEAEGMSLQNIIRKSIWIYYSLRNEAKNGNQIVIHQKDGQRFYATSRFLEDR